jgi:hypothetical protein
MVGAFCGMLGVLSQGEGEDMEEKETVNGYVLPVDPMDALQCESCQ